MKTLDSVLIEQKRSRAVAVDELAKAAVAPASVDSRATARSARDPANRYDPAKPDRDPHDATTLHGTVVQNDPTPEQQRLLDTLHPKDAARFRREHGLKPVS